MVPGGPEPGMGLAAADDEEQRLGTSTEKRPGVVPGGGQCRHTCRQKFNTWSIMECMGIEIPDTTNGTAIGLPHQTDPFSTTPGLIGIYIYIYTAYW